jgi:hypothetical protein
LGAFLVDNKRGLSFGTIQVSLEITIWCSRPNLSHIMGIG